MPSGPGHDLTPTPLDAAFSRLSRRRFLVGLGSAAAAAAFLAACSDDGDDEPAETTSTGTATEATTATATEAATEAATETATGTATEAAAGTYPVTIEHEFGSTTIEAAPTRVVAAGFNEVDFLLAFGVVPVGVRDFIGTYDETQRPWAVDLLAGQEVADIGGTEMDLELVAGLNPDVIMAVYAFLDEGVYTNLAAIAPTVTAPAGGATWQEQTQITGQVLGQVDRAEEIIGEIDQKFADAAAANPDFEGKTLAILWGVSDPGTEYSLLPETDLRAQFFYNLGFVPPPTTGAISPEEANLLDQDVILVFGWTAEQLADDQLYQGLAAVQEGRVAYVTWESDLAGALGFSSPLSIPYAVDLAVPMLAEAVAGNA